MYTKLTDKNRLTILYPELCKEWDHEKNGEFRPENFSYASAYKASWKCKMCGYEWKARIDGRTSGRGCSVCSGKTLSDINRLSIHYPELCEEWNREKNGDLKPEDVSFGSSKKVWWKCKKCQHEWDTYVSHRIKGNGGIKGTGCPICSGFLISDKNRLSKTHQELCLEWNYEKNKNLNPEKVRASSRKKVWWKCLICNSEWENTIYSRTSAKRWQNKCPECKGLSDKNRLSVLRPEIIKIWNYKKNKLAPSDYFHNSNERVWFLCEKGHEWARTISHVKDCPHCKKLKINSFYEKRPLLIKEWDFLKNKILPDNVPWKSSKKVWWICDKNHEYLASIASRSIGGGCPFCAHFRVCKDNCLATLNPKLAKEWHPTKNGNLTPDGVTLFSAKKVWWVCSKGHEWKSQVATRSGGYGCSKCNKVELEDGTICDSLVEAYVYLKLKERRFKIEVGKKYGFGKFKCDFYIPDSNTYLEVTSFSSSMSKYAYLGDNFWEKYYSNILKKKKYVEDILHSKFRFIQIRLNKKQLEIVRRSTV